MGFFDRPEDYDKMLNRMAVITGIIVIISSSFLIQELSEKGIVLPSPKALSNYEIELFGFKGSFWALLPAAVTAWVFRRLRMHDRISDSLKIRESFDVHVILSRLAGEIGIPVDLKVLKKLRENRQDLMYKVFYPFVDANQPKISSHQISEALDAWFGYWIAIEAAVVVLPFGIIFIFLKSFVLANVFVTLALLCVLIGIRYFRTCAPLAEHEISAMTASSDWPQWKVEMQKHFHDALHN